MSQRERNLALFLRALGCLDLLALLAVVGPEQWLDAGHRAAGLGSLPVAPIVGYLARASSAMYVLYGAILIFISYDVVRYERLIRFMAGAAIVHGAVLLAVDVVQQMPLFWRYAEGPGIAVTGTIILWFQRRRE